MLYTLLLTLFSAAHMDEVQGRTTLTDRMHVRSALRLRFFLTGHHLTSTIIKISAAGSSPSWRWPGGKHHVRTHVGPVSSMILELDFI
jgi:hypothetical protein